jgi:hypothetical protein
MDIIKFFMINFLIVNGVRMSHPLASGSLVLNGLPAILARAIASAITV